MGMLDRNMRQVRAVVVPDVKRETLQAKILNHIRKGATVYTDQSVAYDNMSERFVHDVVNHAQEYVKGRVHTNGLENFWSLLKRGLTGTYVAVEPFHMFRYVDEQAFRFNTRKDADGNKINDGARFARAMSQVGPFKHLTYAELTGKDESPRHETTGQRETQVPF
jgi:transposase-like protein